MIPLSRTQSVEFIECQTISICRCSGSVETRVWKESAILDNDTESMHNTL